MPDDDVPPVFDSIEYGALELARWEKIGLVLIFLVVLFVVLACAISSP